MMKTFPVLISIESNAILGKLQCKKGSGVKITSTQSPVILKLIKHSSVLYILFVARKIAKTVQQLRLKKQA